MKNELITNNIQINNDVKMNENGLYEKITEKPIQNLILGSVVLEMPKYLPHTGLQIISRHFINMVYRTQLKISNFIYFMYQI